MTHRERIKAALNHIQPDRVPVDFGSTMTSGISASVVSKLRKSMELDSSEDRIKVNEPFQMLGEIQPDLKEKLFIDTYGLFNINNIFGFKNEDWKPWTMFDGTKVTVAGKFNTVPDKDGNIPIYAEGDKSYPPCAVMPKGGFYFDAISRQKPIDDDNLDVGDNLEDFGPYSDELLEYLENESKRIYEETDYAIIYTMGGASFGDIALVPGLWLKDPKGIRDVEEWYVSTITKRDYIFEVFNRQCDIAIENLAGVKDALQDRIEAIFISGTDFGTQRGPFISPDAYRDLFKPIHMRINGWIHKNTPWKSFIHSCGGIQPLLDDIIEAGFDILNPVQCSADGMDPQKLKDDYGDKVVFWGGGVDTQKTLPFGKPEEVYEEVSERIRIFNKGGGYVFNSIHNIQQNTPVENVMALQDALRDSFK